MSRGTEKPFDWQEAIRVGWNGTKAQWRSWMVLGLVAGFIGLLERALNQTSFHVGFNSLLTMVLEVCRAAVIAVALKWALLQQDGKPLGSIESAFQGWVFLMFLLASVIYGLVVTVGLMLLIVPGVLWAARFAFTPLVIIDQEKDVLEAMRISNRLTRGTLGHLCVFGLVLMGLNLLGALALGVGLLLTVPTSMLAMAHVYRALQARGHSQVRDAGAAARFAHVRAWL